MGAQQRSCTFHNAASATATGTVFNCSGLSHIAVQVTGSFTATVTWQGTVDGTNYVAIQGTNLGTGAVATTATAAGQYLIPISGLRLFRANMTWGSGTSVTVKGIGQEGAFDPQHDIQLAANSGVDIGDVDVTSITAGETHIGEVGGNSSVAEVTLTLDTGAYASGDVLADTQVLTACMRVDQGTAVIHSFVLLDQDDQAQAMDILFLRTNVSIGTENSAVSVTDANADEIIGVIEINTGDYVDLINSQIVCKPNVGIVVDAAAAADDLYIAAICRSGTPTYTASGITCKVGFLRD